MFDCRTPQPPAPGPGVNSARYPPPTRWHSLVGPAIAHELVHLRGTLWWALHPLALLDESHDLRALHLLLKPKSSARVSNQGSLPQPTTRLCPRLPCRASARRRRPPTW